MTDGFTVLKSNTFAARESTFLFCEDWQGAIVLGFHEFLERIRFVVDPNYE